MIAACFAVGIDAQDTVPATPPEMKDFRLDTPPPRDKAPEPTPPAPQPTPPPSAETPRASATTQPRTAPRTAQEPTSTTQPATTGAPASELPQPEATGDVATPASEPVPEATAEPATGTASTTSWLSEISRFWPILAALLALLAGWLAFRWWSGRQSEAVESVAAYEEPTQPAPAPVAPTPPRPAVAPAVAPVKPAGTLTASFEPADARLSLANLVVTGALRLRYDGPKALQSLRLRNLVISACEGQQAMIDAFHADPASGQIDAIGAIQPGEEIVLTLELQVPRAGLQAFDWRERRFIAPILLLHLDSEDPSVAPCRINCLVGQAGDPQSSRMKPLPIDRGPKHFETLQFRPLAA